ncbi:MAG: phosphate acyltransferase, partial [Rikenellaceae bacterium]|nr:phosphate acyltransferase [Rikenellaceae bacterium]
TKIVLFGDQTQITAVLEREKCPVETFEIVHTTQTIEMGENPAQTFVKKPDSSISVGFSWLKAGKISGFASAGSTGAMMVGCMYSVKQIEGVIRPAISTVVPTESDRGALLLDVGLNVDCKPDVLYQYGKLGNLYAKAMMGVEYPRVGLLNIGEEKEKGNLATKAAFESMDGSTEFDFVGNVEAKHIFDDSIADVIVCDGFTGNTILKMAEGLYGLSQRQGLSSPFFDALNYEKVGGTPVLGINAAVVIGHGCSSPEAIKNMVLQTGKAVEVGLVDKFKEAFR